MMYYCRCIQVLTVTPVLYSFVLASNFPASLFPSLGRISFLIRETTYIQSGARMMPILTDADSRIPVSRGLSPVPSRPLHLSSTHIHQHG
jgi:hypothetical protein